MDHPFSDLLERSRKPSRIVVGLMSGTSADSIDVAVCRMTGQGSDVEVELIHYREHAHDPEVKRRVIGIDDLDVRGVAELNVMGRRGVRRGLPGDARGSGTLAR